MLPAITFDVFFIFHSTVVGFEAGESASYIISTFTPIPSPIDLRFTDTSYISRRCVPVCRDPLACLVSDVEALALGGRVSGGCGGRRHRRAHGTAHRLYVVLDEGGDLVRLCPHELYYM